MPRRAARPCSVPGCPNLVRKGSYCEQHQKERWREQNARRPSPAEQGYGKYWQRIRARFLRENPRCEICGGRATVAHHIIRVKDGGRHTYDNLKALCQSCHSRLHAESGDYFKPAGDRG